MKKIYFEDRTAEELNKDKSVMRDYDLVDPHIHTVYSLSRVPGLGIKYPESTIEIKELLKKAKSLNYTTLVITDHDIPRRENNRIGSYFPFKGALKAKEMGKDYGIDVIAGQEIHYTGSSTENGDLLVFPLEEEIPHKYKVGTLENLVDYCDSNNILKCIPHPLSRDRIRWGGNTLIYDSKNKTLKEEINGFDAISNLHAFSYKEINNITQFLTEDRDIAVFGESDAHVIDNFGRAGTLIPKGMNLIDAIKQKETVPFGKSLNKKLAVTRSRSATKSVFSYIEQMREKSNDNSDGLYVFEQIYGDSEQIIRELAGYGAMFFVGSLGKLIESYLYNKSKHSAKKFYNSFFNE